MNTDIDVSKWGGLLRAWCFGSACAICGTLLTDTGEYTRGLCGDCQKQFDLDFAAEPRCPRCGRPLISEQGLCMTCRQQDVPPYDIALALYPYRGVHAQLLEAYKFQKNRAAGHFLAQKLLQSAEYLASLGFHFDAWVPVPPRPGKLKEKGWDQLATLSRFLRGHKRISMPVQSCLKRLPSKAQKRLHRTERAENLKGKFLCIRRVPKRVLLFDDVMTTGATLRSCSQALKLGGAEFIGAVALFYD
ncbi:MAG: ComF family protein [Treponema sp.]|nr:ComF family protein [Treponema sp.]